MPVVCARAEQSEESTMRMACPSSQRIALRLLRSPYAHPFWSERLQQLFILIETSVDAVLILGM
jgi:hypothetical protein